MLQSRPGRPQLLRVMLWCVLAVPPQQQPDEKGATHWVERWMHTPVQGLLSCLLLAAERHLISAAKLSSTLLCGCCSAARGCLLLAAERWEPVEPHPV